MTHRYVFILVVVVVGLVTTTAAQGKAAWEMTFDHDAADVVAACFEVAEEAGLGKGAPSDLLAGDHPYSELTATVPVKGTHLAAILGYRVDGEFLVERTRPGATRVELSFRRTNTVGEDAVYKHLATKFEAGIVETLVAAEATDVAQEVRTGLLDRRTCGTHVTALADSPFDGAIELMIGALGEAPSECATAVTVALADEPAGRDAVCGWLVDRYRAGDDGTKGEIARLAQQISAPTPDLLQVIDDEALRQQRVASSRIDRERQNLVGRWKLTGAKIVVGVPFAVTEILDLGADGNFSSESTDVDGGAHRKSGQWEVEQAGVLLFKVSQASADLQLGVVRYDYVIDAGFELVLTDDVTQYRAGYIKTP